MEQKAEQAPPVTLPIGKPFEDRFGIPRSTQYALVNAGELRSVLIGGARGRRLIFTESWFAYLERQQQREAAGEIGGADPRRARRQVAAAPTPRGTEPEPQPEPSARSKRTEKTIPASSRKNDAGLARTIGRPPVGAPPRQYRTKRPRS